MTNRDGFVVSEDDFLDYNDDDSDELKHYGILRKSGRYPWGSGEDAATRGRDFLSVVEDLKKNKGLSDIEIARGFALYTDDGRPWNTSDFRTAKSVARNAALQADIGMAQRLKDKGLSNVKIGERMGKNESQIRALLAPGKKDKTDVLRSTADMLKEQVTKKTYVDVGTGVEYHIPGGISSTKLATAVSMLKQEGYVVHPVQIDQLGTNNKTIVKVLAPPGTTYTDVKKNRDKIQQVGDYTTDHGRTWQSVLPPKSISSKRVAVKYGPEGGADADGVIYVRPGVKDLSLGGSRYAQVRIAVDGTHYLKGMAMYKDDLPEGVDLMFNTNKKRSDNKLDAMKELKRDKDGNIDPDLPFGSVINRQITRTKRDGTEELTSVMNIVNDEATWEKWSRNLSSQFLSKQPPTLAKGQLDMTYERKKDELERILKLNNPAVRKSLLEDFADGADAAASHLKAAALPGQRTHVILPINSMKENEVYAPNYPNGTRVTLVRFPHGGKFEIPELVVNNKNPEANKLIGGDAKTAIGIHSKVAQKLSGADFDGDTVLVIPNNRGQVKHAPSLEGLKDFDPQSEYPPYDGMQTMAGGRWNAATKKEEFPPGKLPSGRIKGQQMGSVSNLITDMTIKGATADELARAVRHSMVVIDAEKHKLDWKRSAIANSIPALVKKYQDKGNRSGGAATLISRKKTPVDVRERKVGYRIDPATGKKIFVETGRHWQNKDGETVYATSKSTKLKEAENAHELSSGTLIESIYADYSNSMKALGDAARKASVHIKSTPYSSAARTAYAKQVASLEAKLNLALRNAPLERQAQIIGNTLYQQKLAANPDMENSEKKKIKGLSITEARLRVNASKPRIVIEDDEWDAIQAGAITNNMLSKILDNADMDRVKALATPKSVSTMTPTSKARAQAMLNQGYPYSEVAEALGVSVTTLHNTLGKGD